MLGFVVVVWIWVVVGLWLRVLERGVSSVSRNEWDIKK
jgi:hypothetical protein